jgi:hypothetical protein
MCLFMEALRKAGPTNGGKWTTVNKGVCSEQRQLQHVPCTYFPALFHLLRPRLALAILLGKEEHRQAKHNARSGGHNDEDKGNVDTGFALGRDASVYGPAHVDTSASHAQCMHNACTMRR